MPIRSFLQKAVLKRHALLSYDDARLYFTTLLLAALMPCVIPAAFGTAPEICALSTTLALRCRLKGYLGCQRAPSRDTIITYYTSLIAE